jgi:hypothetical protein
VKNHRLGADLMAHGEELASAGHRRVRRMLWLRSQSLQAGTLVIAAVVGVALLPGCGGSSQTPGPSAPSYAKALDATCARRPMRAVFRAAKGRLASLPKGASGRAHALQKVGKALEAGVRRLTAQVRDLRTPGGGSVPAPWLDQARRFAALTKQAAATQRTIIRITSRHPGEFRGMGRVRNADLNHALQTRVAAARSARSQSLDRCAALLAQ